MKIAKTILNKLTRGNYNDWNYLLPFIADAMNRKYSKRTRSEPFTLFFGRTAQYEPLHDVDGLPEASIDTLLERVKQLKEVVWPHTAKQVEIYNREQYSYWSKKHKLLQDLKPNTEVALVDDFRGTKYKHVYQGPYKVVRKTKGGSYVLMDNDSSIITPYASPEKLKVISEPGDDAIDKLIEILGSKDYAPRSAIDIADAKVCFNPFAGLQGKSLDDKVMELEQLHYEFPVTRILAHRITSKGITKYLVKWEHLPERFNTWENESAFSSRQCIFDYWKSQQPARV